MYMYIYIYIQIFSSKISFGRKRKHCHSGNPLHQTGWFSHGLFPALHFIASIFFSSKTHNGEVVGETTVGQTHLSRVEFNRICDMDTCCKNNFQIGPQNPSGNLVFLFKAKV